MFVIYLFFNYTFLQVRACYTLTVKETNLRVYTPLTSERFTTFDRRKPHFLGGCMGAVAVIKSK